MLTLAEALLLLPGARLVGDGATRFLRVHSDSRSLQPGDLFVALAGERFDAHDFLPQAARAGAAAALVSGARAGELQGPGLVVDDTLVALQTLAAGWRRSRCAAVPLVAVTGSNGKTTVTQMVAAILRAWLGDAAFATRGNLNNHIGVPLTLLQLRPEHRAGVVELGMNHAGEIALLAQLAAPDVVLVNNAQREHQEFMDGVAAVARENGSAIEALGADGVAVFPADDAYTPLWRGLAGTRRQLGFALAPPAEVSGSAVWQSDRWQIALRSPAGTATLALRVAGIHNVKNALAASACAIALGAPLAAVVDGLQAFEPVAGRSRVLRLRLHGRELTLVDDSYNANPDSVRAAIELLAALPGPQALLLGDMGEVGARGPEFHAEVGAHARERGIGTLWAVGPLAAHAAAAFGGGRHFDDVPALRDALPELPAVASLLVKGSRFMKMDTVVAALVAAAAGA